MEILKQDGYIVFRFPEQKPRVSPYDRDEFINLVEAGPFDFYSTFTGLIVPQKNCNQPEMGFALTIDMDYKDKPDQWGEIAVRWFGEKQAFVDKCVEMGIEVFEYDRCARCKGAIYGTSTSSLELNKKYGGAVCSITCED